ncbi:hypothetical protein PanWU01x14_287810 [Parasponia andersonii]|uniref:Uncharacterized protein n=1 Tax=Parasponia andersonii TaxID=3476 RepID=A0A2P5AYP0_PARAD|nr:hypothetical protein PanWU01x14_287810 [Parasponia andersonii]
MYVNTLREPEEQHHRQDKRLLDHGRAGSRERELERAGWGIGEPQLEVHISGEGLVTKARRLQLEEPPTSNSLLLLVPYPREALISFKANTNLWEAPCSPDPSNLTKTLLTSLKLA